VRHDAQRAAERGYHAGARAARKAGGQRVEHARAGRHDDDERGDQEFETQVGGHGDVRGLAMGNSTFFGCIMK